MTRQRHYVIYVPGIKDDLFYVQTLLLQAWRLRGVRPVMFTMPWFGNGAFEPKLSRLVSKIDTYHKQGHKVSLVGTSAGASAVLNAYALRKDDILRVVYICGKINQPNTVSDRTYARNLAFKTSLLQLQNVLSKLDDKDKRKLSSFYSPADITVPHVDTVIEGVAEQRLPALTHMWAILYILSIGSGRLLHLLKED